MTYDEVLTAHLMRRVLISHHFYQVLPERMAQVPIAASYGSHQNSNSPMKRGRLCRCLAVHFAANSLWQACQETMLVFIGEVCGFARDVDGSPTSLWVT